MQQPLFPKLPEIQAWFKKNGIPKGEYRMSRSSTIVNPQKFIESTIATLHNYSDNKTFMPYYNKLCAFYEIVKNSKTNNNGKN